MQTKLNRVKFLTQCSSIIIIFLVQKTPLVKFNLITPFFSFFLPYKMLIPKTWPPNMIIFVDFCFYVFFNFMRDDTYWFFSLSFLNLWNRAALWGCGLQPTPLKNIKKSFKKHSHVGRSHHEDVILWGLKKIFWILILKLYFGFLFKEGY